MGLSAPSLASVARKAVWVKIPPRFVASRFTLANPVAGPVTP